MTNAQKVMAYLVVSLLSSFIFAISFVVVMTLTLPETDMAHGMMPFEDPLVFPLMSMVAVASGILAWPFYTVFGWRHSPERVGVVAGQVTLVFIVVATAVHPSFGFFGSYPILLLTLITCRFTMKRNGQQMSRAVAGKLRSTD